MINDKSYICFCVEGPTDERSIKQQFSALFDSRFGDQVDIEFRWPKASRNATRPQGDLTSMEGVTPETIEKTIYKFYFKSQDSDSSYSWDDFTHIIHIIDIDGVYVDNVSIFSQEEETFADSISSEVKKVNTLYCDDHIAVRKSPMSYLEMHKRKIKNIDYLRGKSEIVGNPKKKPIKYCLFYFSSNLDHVLSGKANLSSVEKGSNSRKFSAEYSDPQKFIELINAVPDCQTDYEVSWQLLWKGNHSLSRHTNINILINQIQNSSIEDWL